MRNNSEAGFGPTWAAIFMLTNKADLLLSESIIVILDYIRDLLKYESAKSYLICINDRLWTNITA